MTDNTGGGPDAAIASDEPVDIVIEDERWLDVRSAGAGGARGRGDRRLSAHGTGSRWW